MSLIERYIFRMASLSFLAALGGLTGVIWVTQALKDFDLLTSKGQSMLIFFSATSLIIPSLVMIIAPIALFAAVLFTLNKLNSDSELVVLSAAGLPETVVAAAIPLIAPIDWVIARLRSAVNVLSDMLVAILLDAWDRRSPSG
jgi:lipopolysaccharide export system permease protein